MNAAKPNPAELAAQESLSRMYKCLDEGRNFRFEAGAGAGKTESLKRALKYLIEKHGPELVRRNQRIACITYTNVARDEIENRTDRHPAILSATIHSFCWSLIRNFQPVLKEKLPELPKWQERLEESGGIGARKIDYELGHAKVHEERISLGHNDILLLMTELMAYRKFRNLFTSRYPVLLIDEYQDTDRGFAEAIKVQFIDANEGPLIGFFGDHWQKIYGTGCGNIEHTNLRNIYQGANFRSVKIIVDVLNHIRPELPQEVVDPNAQGSVAVYHTNRWGGQRRSGPQWAGDLPAEVAREHLEHLKAHLTEEGWDFVPEKTKILMLTHRVLAANQGYEKLIDIFPYTEDLVRKDHPYILFLVDTLEPVCAAYEKRRFGDMFAAIGGHSPTIQSFADKSAWARDMSALMELRSTGTIGSVLDHLKQTGHPSLPDAIEQKERQFGQLGNQSDNSEMEIIRTLRDVPYQEIIELDRFIDDKTPFSTKHGVKGAEFDNVLVVFGRGWNQYNFSQFLEWAGNTINIPPGRQETFERNRNLFYVVCSRPKKRLALLFTQQLSDQAIATLEIWFGRGNIHSLRIES